jgi:hypothetical protein
VSGRPSPRACLLAALPALALTGCGHVARVASGAALRIALNVRAAPGALTIVVRNNGRLAHDLVITENGTPVAMTPPLAPGQATNLVTTLGPGRYLMSSTILSDQALGVYGTLDIGH